MTTPVTSINASNTKGVETSLQIPTFLLPPSSSARRLPSPVSATATRNPISLRLYKVLGANYQDASTREALETLSSFYAPSDPTEANGLQIPKTPAAEELSDDGEQYDMDSIWGLDQNLRSRKDKEDKSLEDGDIAARARKSLRRDVEARLADQSQKFLKAFAEVDQKLEVLQLHVKDMHNRCDEAQTRLQSTNEGCQHLLDRAGGLRAQRQSTTARQSIITLFLSRFTLTDSETDALTSREIPVGKAVFEAMDRVENIRNDCRVLLSGEEGETKAGLEIMSLTASLLDQGYHKLARWCSFEFRQLGKDSQTEVNSVMKEAVRRLRHTPALLMEALKVFSEVRQNALMTSFIDALTKGGPGGLPRPIELHAHDPTRYVGDMLAWVHQVMAGEREYLESLFGVKGDGRMVGSIRKKRSSEEEEYIDALMDTNLEKLCTPLRLRVQQTVKSQEGSVTAYKLANLVQFYTLTITRTIGEEAILSQTLRQITDVAYKVFFDALDAQGRSVLRFLHPPDADLSPPLALRDSAQVLREIMAVYDSSLLGHEDPEEREGAFSKILEASLSPALEMCYRMSDLRKDMSVWEKAVFLINCAVYLQTILQLFSFTGSHIDLLQTDVDKNVQTLVDEHYNRFLVESGLSSIVEAINGTDSGTPLSRIPSASSQVVTASLTQFDVFLSQLDVASSPRLLLLSVPRISTSIHSQAIRRIGLAYGVVCEAIRNPENRYEFASTLLGSRRPFGDMSVLWQVLGVNGEPVDAPYST